MRDAAMSVTINEVKKWNFSKIMPSLIERE
jgi:hypothetical protein